MIKTPKEHRAEVLAKVIPYLEAVMDNIKLEATTKEHHAFGALIENFANILRLSEKTKGSEEYIEFARYVTKLLSENIFDAIDAKESVQIVQADSEEEADAIMKQVAGSNVQTALKVTVNQRTGEIEIEGDLENAPQDVKMKLAQKLNEIGIPKAVILNILGGK